MKNSLQPKFDFNEFIKNSNEEFLKATKAEQIIMIAQDVILRINNKNIKPTIGQILVLNDKDISKYSDESFKDILNDNKLTTCRVCAKGALFCSIIGRTNKITVNTADRYESTNTLGSPKGVELKKYFTEEQIDMIETAYEGRSYINIIKDADILTKCKAFYKLHKSNMITRMIAICENIIENKGEFKP